MYSGVWNPHGTLFCLKKRGGVSVEGFQKGLDITLKSFDPEVGLQAPPEYAIAGTLNLRNNTMIGTVTHYSAHASNARKTNFTPAIPISGAYPQFVFKIRLCFSISAQAPIASDLRRAVGAGQRSMEKDALLLC